MIVTAIQWFADKTCLAPQKMCGAISVFRVEALGVVMHERLNTAVGRITNVTNGLPLLGPKTILLLYPPPEKKISFNILKTNIYIYIYIFYLYILFICIFICSQQLLF